MAQVSKRERWLIGLGATAAIAVAAYVYGLEPALERRREAAQLIPAREVTLERRRQIVAQRAVALTESEETAKRLEEQSKRFLTGPTPPLAASELQRLVKDLAVGAGVQVRSERVLAPADREGLQEIPIEITVAGGIRECMGLLYELERTGKLLTIQDLKMRVLSMGQPRDLLTTVTVSGYLLLAGGPTRPPDRPGPGTPPPPS